MITSFPGLDLGAANSFGNEAANMGERFITVTLTNDTDNAHEVSLTPSYHTTNTKVLADGVIGGIAGLTGASSSEDVTIAQVLKSIDRNSYRVLRTQIESKNSTQLTKSMTLQEKDIFGNKAPEKINLASYKSAINPNEKLITVTKQFQLDNDT